MPTYENAVFISYAWGGESDEIVNKIDQSLQARGLKIIRDKRSLPYKGSIKEFMERIGQGDCIIVVISDKYLKSPNCMFELVEIAEDKQFVNRIFPVILADAGIYKIIKQAQYIKYWEDQITELKETIKTLDPTNLQGLYEQLNLYDRIRDNFSRLTSILSDMNALTPELHQESGFNILYTNIEKRMRETNTAMPENPMVLATLNQKPSVYSYFQATPAHLRRSFDSLMADKLQGFVGRKFVFDALDEFLKNNPSGYFIIRGVPGIGKTALMAKLINDRGYIHHFNVASQNIRSPRVFLENICAQLISRYGLLHKELPPDAAEDSSFLMQCLGEAAANSKNHPIIIAIDSLDEADRLGLASAVNTLYLPSSLPQGVYIVVTMRPLDDLHLQVMRQETLDIEADSEGNLRDIDAYIANYVKREAMRARLSAWKVETGLFSAALRKKSQGNFMYLYYILPAIERGQFVKGTLDELPNGLKAYYQRHWRQMREGKGKEFEILYAPIVCILGVAQEPVTIEQIAAWTKLSPGQVKDSIALWREFLEEEQLDRRRCYRIYHASFQDFLKDQVDLVRFDDMIAEYYLSLSEQGK